MGVNQRSRINMTLDEVTAFPSTRRTATAPERR